MKIHLLLVLCVIATSCSTGGGGLGSNPDVQRLLLSSFTPGGTEIELSLSGPITATFPAVTYFIYGTSTDMGNQSIIPLQHERLNEQAIGPFAFGDPAQDIDLTPWEDFAYLYLRAIAVSPNKGWKLVPGKIYEFSTN